MKRRDFLKNLGAAAVGVELTARDRRDVVAVQQETTMARTHQIGWSEFVDRASAAFADVEDKESLDDEHYVFALAAIAARLNEVPDVETFANDGLGPSIRTGPIMIRPRQPFFTLKWAMTPNAVLPYHNHPNYSFVTLVLEGSLRIRNFEITGAAPGYDDPSPFPVLQTLDQVLVPGRVNTLTRSRDYIHSFEAGDAGATGIDIGILHTEDVGFSYLAIDDPRPSTVVEARWDRELTRAVRGR